MRRPSRAPPANDDMTYRLAAFDFDGTLADSFHYFVSNVNSLARRHGFREMDPSRLNEYRGLDPRELMRAHGVPMWKLPFIAKDLNSCQRFRTAMACVLPPPPRGTQKVAKLPTMESRASVPQQGAVDRVPDERPPADPQRGLDVVGVAAVVGGRLADVAR